VANDNRETIERTGKKGKEFSGIFTTYCRKKIEKSLKW
jgi:hypothetical protein